MATPKWQPGRLYAPGSIVQPLSAQASGPDPVIDGNMVNGFADWWFSPAGGTASIRDDKVYAPGSRSGWYTNGGDRLVVELTQHPVQPGQRINGQAFFSLDTPDDSLSRGQSRIAWFDVNGDPISNSEGELIRGESRGEWRRSTVSANAPSNARFASFAYYVTANGHGGVLFSGATWDLGTPTIPAGLVYKAVQPALGYSGANEPAWPPVNGEQVIDNEVVWEAMIVSQIIWQAKPILKSGPVEPEWPEAVGGFVQDGTINWEAVSFHVEDPRCPNSPYVVIDRGKVYAGDEDIIAFCAVNNPLDWTTRKNAGYIAFGLNKYGANPVRALGLYRGNLAAFNSQGFQLWQIDPDPELNAILDALPIGSIFHKAFAPVSNDAFFLARLGVRTIGIAASSTNLKAGDVGLPIDPLVQAKINNGEEPISLYSSSAGQYWLIFRYPLAAEPNSEVFVYTITQIGQVGAWSRYLVPFSIDAYTIDGDILVVRGGNEVLEIEEGIGTDRTDSPNEVEFESTLWWPYLSMGSIGQDKGMEGFDIVTEVAEGVDPLTVALPRVSFGWDQRNRALFTEEIECPLDTEPDYFIPMELTAPSISVKIRYTGAGWQFTALNLYLQGWSLGR